MKLSFFLAALFAVSFAPRVRAASAGAPQDVAPQNAAPLPTADFAGRPFVTQKAPVLKFEKRTAPRLYGVDYPFAPQTARGVALFSRFPPFSLRDRRIHVSGPWYSDARANLHFSRGITTIEALPNFRLPGADPSTDVRLLPRGQKWQIIDDHVLWRHAGELANELATKNPQDELIAPLRVLASDHKFSLNEAAYREVGKHLWRGETGPTDAKNEGVLYPCLDIESTDVGNFQRQCLGWIYAGMRDAAAERELKIIPVAYGQWTFSVGAFWLSHLVNGTGEPEYLLPEKDALQGYDPTIQVLNETGGAVPMDGYLQAIWGDEPFYQRDAKGAIRFQNGAPLWNDIEKNDALWPGNPTGKGRSAARAGRPVSPGDAHAGDATRLRRRLSRREYSPQRHFEKRAHQRLDARHQRRASGN